jgi:surfactin synthase thioesterase subunit
MSTADMWFPYRHGASGFKLFAFPHAGAGPTVFNFLREALGRSDTSVIPAVLAGRGRRIRAAPHESMDTLLAEFEDMARRDQYSAFTGNYGLLGHCSGALVAYEIAKILVRLPCPDPQLLAVCSCLPPPVVRDTGASRLPTRELLAQTAMMGGTPVALMDDRDFLEVLERPLRADMRLYDGYVYQPSARLPIPILAVRGTADPDISSADLRLWHDHTSREFVMKDADAGHWTLTQEGSSVLAREISAILAAATVPSQPEGTAT